MGQRLTRARAGRYGEALPLRRECDRLFLMLVVRERRIVIRRRAENAGTSLRPALSSVKIRFLLLIRRQQLQLTLTSHELPGYCQKMEAADF